ncbi:hypothetical protein [Paraburkholderia sp. C35]|uniref:hypothetical protein n=1 Tax=Paraburkholderia sp. C35 TaxID=2126993 RepID=UPI0013A53BB2|nr:hypothetical protein [Paraburkholderia sp. C35]
MPLSNVFVPGIEGYERLIGAVRMGQVNLPKLLRAAAAANQDGATSRIFCSDSLRDKVRKTGWTCPHLISAAQDRVDRLIAEAIKLPADGEV